MIVEPPDKTFVAWFDDDGDPYAVFRRCDAYAPEGDWWFSADQRPGFDHFTWPDLLKEMADMRGPVELLMPLCSVLPEVTS